MERFWQDLWHNQKGMSLFELVVGFMLMAIVLGLAITIISLNANMINISFDNTFNRASLAKTIDVVRSDVQKLSPDSVLHAESNRLTFYSIDGNYVDYRKSQDKLYRNGELLLEDLVAEPFAFLNDSLNVVESVNHNFCFVRLTLEVEKKGQSIRAEGVFYLRN